MLMHETQCRWSAAICGPAARSRGSSSTSRSRGFKRKSVSPLFTGLVKSIRLTVCGNRKGKSMRESDLNSSRHIVVTGDGGCDLDALGQGQTQILY